MNLARSWINRPALTNLTLTDATERPIPDQGFIVAAQGQDVPVQMLSIPALEPAASLHPDTPPGELTRTDNPTASTNFD